MTTPGCILSVDLEDYKQTATLEMGVPRRTAPERTAHGVARILEILSRSAGARRATFFATGHVARSQPELIARLADDGHEIGCHADEHEDVDRLDRASFGATLDRAVASIEDAAGAPVYGFRAPNFSIGDRDLWALEVLSEHGFVYDSSLVGSVARAAATPYDIYSFAGRPLYEFPLYRHALPGGAGVRVIGGTYLRVLPVPVILRLMHRVSELGYLPMVYVHPADIDDDFEPVRMREMAGLGRLARWKWGVRQRQWATGTARAGWKLAEILRHFPNRGPFIGVLQERGLVPRPATEAPTLPETVIAGSH